MEYTTSTEKEISPVDVSYNVLFVKIMLRMTLIVFFIVHQIGSWSLKSNEIE